MSFKDEINKYIPINNLEGNDKSAILKLINKYGDRILFRENEECHMTVSAWITNFDHTKVLLNFHNLYNNWGWLGGHADGCDDPISVIIKEIKEESGLTNIKLISDEIASIEILPVFEHYKKNKYVPKHLHLNITYLFEANENDPLYINKEENSGLKWVDINEVINMTNEEHMKPIYIKLNNRIK